MGILQVLVFQLLLVPALSVTEPVHDFWGEFGLYGACSRTCGSGVSLRTRKCITSRTDGGHNCLGSSKSYRICNSQECPVGSRDFREEQCSQFDRSDFQGKHHTWIPYLGGQNPCELSCVARGRAPGLHRPLDRGLDRGLDGGLDFTYRHRPAVVDGTRCYVGRNDICIDGVCRLYIRGEIMGLDEEPDQASALVPASVPASVPVSVPVSPRVHSYSYRVGVYGACTAPCGGGLQYRSVECWEQEPGAPRVVEEVYCITQRLQRPATQQACNMYQCSYPEYSVSSYSACSVTCGEGQQRREVFCVRSSGERLPERLCSSVPRPESARVCRRPACATHALWHVTDYGLCTRSCGGGVRERRVSCLDLDLNPQPEAQCGAESRPQTVETCNSQPCPGPQRVPSVQEPRSHETTMRGFVPHVPEDPTASRPAVPRCAQTYYGCCPDGVSPAAGPRSQGCHRDDCVTSRYGCCLDGLTPAPGFGRAGCPEYQGPTSSEVCALPRDEGPCDSWKVRFYFDAAAGKCVDFWYGSCHGNGNNFLSLEACQRLCGHLTRETPAGRRVSPRVSAGRV